MQTRELGRSGLVVSAQGLGCMGMSQSYGTADESESLATVAPGARPRRDVPRHRRRLRRRPQRAAGRAGDRRPPRRGGARHEVLAEPRRAGPDVDQRPARLRPRLHATRACSGWASTTSTCTTSTGSTRRCRSRTPSARWPSWSRPARCAISGCRRPVRAASSARVAVHPITALQSEWSLWTRDLEVDVLATARASSGSGSCRSARWAAGS